MKTLYETQATAVGGRAGCAASADGRLRVRLDLPKCLGGDDREGTNPEQLFAAGFAAAFLSAIKGAAAGRGVDIAPDSNVTASVALGSTDGRYALKVALSADLPGLDDATCRRIIEDARAACPYSRATRGNIEVRVEVG
ncbi:Ohr family peroxiredoxin [Rhizorhabdus argentea]|uniref:Ohr family peroxiredoxin n=1 Tax=Rhizorhabdus argentea TaxID=1387174 RepID=UPI0030EE326F